MSKLGAFFAELNPLERNRLLFEWLRDDLKRAELYRELRNAGFPVLQFKSVLRSDDRARWPNEDVYLLSKKEHVETALKHYSVEPYRGLDSGGRFMLGLDNRVAHWAQNDIAAAALRFNAVEIGECAREAVRRASVLLQKNHQFNLPVDLAGKAALHFVELLFGFRDEAHVALMTAMGATYQRLVFQIIGRHFVWDASVPPSDSPAAKKLREELDDEIRIAATKQPGQTRRTGAPERTVIERLVSHYGDPGAKELTVVALGLIAGTVGNITAAISISIDHFFTQRDGAGRLIDHAREAAQRGDDDELKTLIAQAFVRNPPAPFLARASVGRTLGYKHDSGQTVPIPDGAHILLAMGAAETQELVFGGPPHQPEFLHRCIGEHLAKPLICEVVRHALLLPGLSQDIDPASGAPFGLKKRWGVICESYPLRFQRDRRLNQQPLFVVLPIKEPVKENADKLKALTRAGAYVVEDALDKSRHVHFAWFMLVENETHLAMATVYDGDFDAYVEHFALDVSLFDKQFEFLAVEQPTPIRDYPKQFVENIRKYNRTPLGGYFYSAYPTTTVADLDNTTNAAP
jgi:hypothetical protein